MKLQIDTLANIQETNDTAIKKAQRRTSHGYLLPMLLCILFVCSDSLLAFAQNPLWDITGSREIYFEIQDGYYQFTLQVTNEDFQTGEFGANIPDWPGNNLVNGQINGSSISFTIYPGWGGNSQPFSGTIATNGMSGGTSGNNGHGIWYGFWGEVAGQLVPLQVSAPVFTLQPVSQVVAAGQPATFTAIATGDPAVSYQWQFNGTNIDSATNSSFGMSSTSITNLGLYDVVASNAVGTNTSTTATLSFLNMQCFPGLVLYGPAGATYNIQSSPMLGSGTNWTTLTNITLTSSQPYIYIDYSSVTNSGLFYQAVPVSP